MRLWMSSKEKMVLMHLIHGPQLENLCSRVHFYIKSHRSLVNKLWRFSTTFRTQSYLLAVIYRGSTRFPLQHHTKLLMSLQPMMGLYSLWPMSCYVFQTLPTFLCLQLIPSHCLSNSYFSVKVQADDNVQWKDLSV